MKNPMEVNEKSKASQLVITVLSIGVIGSSIVFPNAALADEIGRETEAPTLFTGETVEVRVFTDK